jgi:hypothetical protein
VPQELFSRWKLAKGDTVFVTDAENGVELGRRGREREG